MAYISYPNPSLDRAYVLSIVTPSYKAPIHQSNLAGVGYYLHGEGLVITLAIMASELKSWSIFGSLAIMAP